MTVHVELVLVTPQMAQQWLTNSNFNNRALRATTVDRYAAAMLAKAFEISDSNICFAPDGRLLNGQHRLAAVVQSGVSVWMLVAHNVPDASYQHMDRGAGRNYADFLRSKGEANGILLAATLSKLIAFDRGVSTRGLWSTQDPTVSDLDRSDYLVRYPQIRDSLIWGRPTAMKGAAGCAGSILVLGALLITLATDQKMADCFMYQLTTQDREPAIGTVRAAVRAIEANKAHRGHIGLDRNLQVICSTWNHWAVESELTMIKVPADFRARLPRFTTRVTREGLFGSSPAPSVRDSIEWRRRR